MATGYGGTYRGFVVDDTDPMQDSRLMVTVPEVYGEAFVWAVALRYDAEGALPAVGDPVLVSFERGDTDYPVWEPASGVEERGTGRTGYIGKYRGVVVANEDPLQRNRLEVTVPEISSTPAWATASDEVEGSEPPDVGAEVWIEYDHGDPGYPRWVGLA